MLLRTEGEITWDGHSLSVLVSTGEHAVLCIVPRETVHGISPYDDAIEREIERDKADILDRLRPAILKKIEAGMVDRTGPVAHLRLNIADFNPR